MSKNAILTEQQLLDVLNSKTVAAKSSEKRSFKYLIPEGVDEKTFRKDLRDKVQIVLSEFKTFALLHKGKPTKEAFMKSECFKQFAEINKVNFVKGVKFSEMYTPQKGGRNFVFYSALNQILKTCE